MSQPMELSSTPVREAIRLSSNHVGEAISRSNERPYAIRQANWDSELTIKTSRALRGGQPHASLMQFDNYAGLAELTEQHAAPDLAESTHDKSSHAFSRVHSTKPAEKKENHKAMLKVKTALGKNGTSQLTQADRRNHSEDQNQHNARGWARKDLDGIAEVDAEHEAEEATAQAFEQVAEQEAERDADQAFKEAAEQLAHQQGKRNDQLTHKQKNQDAAASRMLANAVNTHMKGSKQEPAVRPDEIAKVLSLGGNAAKAIAGAPIEEERETKEASRQKKSVVQPAAGLSPESLGTADDAPTFWDSNELEAHLDKQKKQDYLETEWPFGGLFHHGNKSSGNSSDSSTNSSSNSTSSSSLTTSEEGDGSQETNSTSSDNSTSSTNSSDLMGPSNSSISSSASNASSSNNASTALLEVHIAESSLGGLCRVGAHDGAEDDQGIAEVGAPCLFGLVEEDEGRHCIRGRRYGQHGWCYTKADLSSWGPCAAGCPQPSQARLLQDDSQSDVRIAARLKHVLDGWHH